MFQYCSLWSCKNFFHCKQIMKYRTHRIYLTGSSERSPFVRKRHGSVGGGSLKAGAGSSDGSPKLSPHHSTEDHPHYHHHPHAHHCSHPEHGRRLMRSLSESSLVFRRAPGRGRLHGKSDSFVSSFSVWSIILEPIVYCTRTSAGHFYGCRSLTIPGDGGKDYFSHIPYMAWNKRWLKML